MAYAESTMVPVGRTQEHIRQVLQKHNASGFGFGEFGGKAMITFDMSQRRMRFILPLPAPPKADSTQVTHKKYEQSIRSKWRSLFLAIKAKLECVESGISTLEEEFLANIVLPNGKTVGDSALPAIKIAYSGSEMPPLLGGGQSK